MPRRKSNLEIPGGLCWWLLVFTFGYAFSMCLFTFNVFNFAALDIGYDFYSMDDNKGWSFLLEYLFPSYFILFWLLRLCGFIPRKSGVFSKHGYHLLLVSFPFLNLLLGILYYRLCYDPEGTLKPQWTDYLG